MSGLCFPATRGALGAVDSGRRAAALWAGFLRNARADRLLLDDVELGSGISGGARRRVRGQRRYLVCGGVPRSAAPRALQLDQAEEAMHHF